MNRVARLVDMSEEELKHEVTVLEDQIFHLRIQLQTGNVMNPSRVAQTRRDLARVKTLLRERELGIRRGSEPSAAAQAAPDRRAGSEAE
jgi:large subunit ribosomal protein L29